MTTLYIIIGLLWSGWAIYNQIKLFGVDSSRIIAAAVINFIFWPAGMLMAWGKSSAFQRFKKTFYTMPPGFRLQKYNDSYRWHDGFISSTPLYKWAAYREAWDVYWDRMKNKDTSWHDVNE